MIKKAKLIRGGRAEWAIAQQVHEVNTYACKYTRTKCDVKLCILMDDRNE